MRLIDADALKKSVPNTHVDIFENCRNCELLDDEQVEELIDNAPTIDAVPVVRCKDCKHCEYASNRIPTEQAWVCYKLGIDVEQDWFCADGERKDDDKYCDTCKHCDKGWDDIVCDGCTKAYSNWERRDDDTERG